MRRMTYYWKIQTADRRGAGTDARIRLALHGDEADMKPKPLVPMFAQGVHQLKNWEMQKDVFFPRTVLGSEQKPFAANTWTFGQFVDHPYLGNLLTGELTLEERGAFPDWYVETVWIKQDARDAIWVANDVGLVQAGAPTRLTFELDYEGRYSPLRQRKRDEEDARLKEEDPQEWVANRRAQLDDIKNVTGVTPRDRELEEIERKLKARDAARTAPGAQRDPARKGQIVANEQSMGDPLPEAALEALRARGLTDAQIVGLLGSTKGRPLQQQEGRPAQSSEPNRGSDFEGFSFQSASAVKIADEDEAVEV